MHAKLCKIYRVYCLHYSLNEPVFEMKNTNFVHKVLQRNQILNEWIWIIRYFPTPYQLLNWTISDMPFETKLTTLINTQGLTDNASL